MRIELSSGLVVSQEILKRLKKRKGELKGIDIFVGTFTNCRECGYTYMVSKGEKNFTFCTYEHRNSDDIIINGKEGRISGNGDLPYISDSKWAYLGSAYYKEYDRATDILIERIKKEFIL